MTRFLFIFILIFHFSHHVQSQISKGDWMFDFNTNLEYTEEDDLSLFTFKINPSGAYFPINRIAAGTGLTYQLFRTTGGIIKSHTFGFNPFIKYYFLNRRITPFFQAEGTIFWVKRNQTFTDDKIYLREVILRTGLSVFLSKNAAFEAAFGYPISEKKTLSFSDFDTPERIQLSLGFKYFFNGNAEKSELNIFPFYLEKDSRSIRLSAVLDFSFLLEGGASFQKFTKDYRRWNHSFSTFWATEVGDIGLFNIWLYRVEYQSFIKLKERIFFASGIGSYLSPGWFGKPADFTLATSAFVRPSLFYFFNRAILETGFEFVTPYLILFEEETDFTEEFGGNLSFSYEYFVQNNLSLKATLIYNAFGVRNFEEFSSLEFVPPTYFKIGVSYFLNAK